MGNTVTIDEKEYMRLIKQEELLQWLEARGVDNWVEYGHPPYSEDYDNDDDYEKAYNEAIEDMW